MCFLVSCVSQRVTYVYVQSYIYVCVRADIVCLREVINGQILNIVLLKVVSEFWCKSTV